MHKRLYNEVIITLTLSPDGPILIKAGEKGADPTRPDMEFVRTVYQGREMIYLPGSSLKGVFRAHCERIARTADTEEAQAKRGKPLSCNPLDEKHSCSKKWEAEKKRRKDQGLQAPTGAEIYTDSCFICQLFGNTSLASHLRITDAYPVDFEKVRLEERNGVAIDRVFGSVAVGPFNFEVCTEGEFQTTIYVRNFTLAQLGLLALALRDLEAGRVGLGFAKSRGLGQVKARLGEVVLRYPVCQVKDGQVMLWGSEKNVISTKEVAGVGVFLEEKEREDYGYPPDDRATLPNGLSFGRGELGEAELKLSQVDEIKALWRECCVPKWQEVIGYER